MKECVDCNIVCEDPKIAADPDNCPKCGKPYTEQS